MGPYCGMTAPKAPPLAASSRGCHLANDTAAGPELQLRAPGRSEDPRNSPWGWPRAGAPLRQLGVGAGCGGAGQAVVRPPPPPGVPVRATLGPAPCRLCFPFGSHVRSDTACRHEFNRGGYWGQHPHSVLSSTFPRLLLREGDGVGPHQRSGSPRSR